MSDLGKKLKFLREKMRYTQLEVATQLHIGNTFLSNYETGVNDPDYKTLKEMAKLYNVSLDYLLESDYKDRFIDPVFLDLFDQLKSLPPEDLETIQIITRSLVIKNKDAAAKLAKKAE